MTDEEMAEYAKKLFDKKPSYVSMKISQRAVDMCIGCYENLPVLFTMLKLGLPVELIAFWSGICLWGIVNLIRDLAREYKEKKGRKQINDY